MIKRRVPKLDEKLVGRVVEAATRAYDRIVAKKELRKEVCREEAVKRGMFAATHDNLGRKRLTPDFTPIYRLYRKLVGDG